MDWKTRPEELTFLSASMYPRLSFAAVCAGGKRPRRPARALREARFARYARHPASSRAPCSALALLWLRALPSRSFPSARSARIYAPRVRFRVGAARRRLEFMVTGARATHRRSKRSAGYARIVRTRTRRFAPHRACSKRALRAGDLRERLAPALTGARAPRSLQTLEPRAPRSHYALAFLAGLGCACTAGGTLRGRV